jgi:hypothetical protein
LWTLDQPIVDRWGFRPAQTAISVQYILHEGAWLANIVPVFGEPWVFPQEFPLYQWCVALLALATGSAVGVSGRLVSAFFAVAVLWPLYLLSKETRFGSNRRITLLVGALWLLAPVVVFWGRSTLIETTAVFVSLAWLAFYVRFLAKGKWVDYGVCLGFGVLAATVKITAFAPFIVAGFSYTCIHIWHRQKHIVEQLVPLLLGFAILLLSAVALFLWNGYAHKFLIQNPLAAYLSVSNPPMQLYYFGVWSDRWSYELWDRVIRLRDLPDALGTVWFIPIFGLLYVIFRNRAFWLTLALIASYLSGYMFFPRLYTYNPYYLLENIIPLCAAVVVVIEGLLQRGHVAAGYGILLAAIISQVWSLYTGTYGPLLFDDLHKHPYYEAGLAVKKATPPNSVVVAFGMMWGADLPYYAERRGIIVPNGVSDPVIRQILFEERDRWFGGRKLSAMVDCTVFEIERIAPALEPIRDLLKEELKGKTIEITGSFHGADILPPKCEIYLAKE